MFGQNNALFDFCNSGIVLVFFFICINVDYSADKKSLQNLYEKYSRVFDSLC